MSTEASPITLRGWALVLGASSGFGAATSLALARAGMNVFGVHLDRKSTLPNVERLASEILVACIDAGGSITGEHGVGADKTAYMADMFGEDDLADRKSVV